MGFVTKTREAFRVLGEFLNVILLLRDFKMPGSADKVSLGAAIEDAVARYPDNLMLLFEGLV
jgi:hypothetical protein